jgi:NADH dehydrogenase
MILVTGGTGFVGREVVGELLALDYQVRLLVRNPAKAPAFPNQGHHPRVELVQGDVLKPETLSAAMVGVKALIHLVGIITENAYATYEQAHTEATRSLLTAAKQAGVTRWVQMSAIGTRPHARSRYHRSKWEAEELVRQSGLDWTILRPSLIYGFDEHDRLLNMMRMFLSFPLDFIQAYSFPLIDGGRPHIQPVSVKEVARCFALAPAKEAAIGQTYDLVGPVAFTWREMIFRILAALGKKGLYEEIPLLLLVRVLLGLVVVLFPVVLIVVGVNGHLPSVAAEIGAGIWVGLILIAIKWRRVIVFSLPGEALILASELLNGFAPRALRPSEVLKMSVEDNVGDPGPAATTFGYVPETFEQGLAKLLK